MMQLRGGAVATGVLLFGLGALALGCASGGDGPILLAPETNEGEGGNDGGGISEDSSQVVSDYSPTVADDSGSGGGGSGDDSPTSVDGLTGGDASGSAAGSGDSGSCNAPTCAACVSGNPCCTTMGTCGCTWILGCIGL